MTTGLKNLDTEQEITPEELDDIFLQCNVMSAKRRLFIVEYVKCHNARMAAEKVYNTKNPRQMGSECLCDPKVKAAINKISELIGARSSVQPEYVTKKLIRTIEKADADGNHSATLRGLDILARTLGMYTEKVEVTGKDGEAIKLEQKVNEDVAAFKGTMAGLIDRARERELPKDTLQ